MMTGAILLLLAAAGPYLTIPPNLEDRLVYYRSFDAPDGAPELDTTAGTAAPAPPLQDDGLIGQCAATGKPGQLLLHGPAFSPHRPLTIAFWWALAEDCPENGGYSLVHLYHGNAFVSLFGRGGPWCALDDTAAVLQVWDVPGIPGVNGIYDRRVRQQLDLRAGKWHHTALTFSGGLVVAVYTDGTKSFEVQLTGRALSADDQLHDLQLGAPSYAGTTRVDELLIWQRTLTAGDVADYVTAIRSMLESGHLGPPRAMP